MLASGSTMHVSQYYACEHAFVVANLAACATLALLLHISVYIPV